MGNFYAGRRMHRRVALRALVRIVRARATFKRFRSLDLFLFLEERTRIRISRGLSVRRKSQDTPSRCKQAHRCASALSRSSFACPSACKLPHEHAQLLFLPSCIRVLHRPCGSITEHAPDDKDLHDTRTDEPTTPRRHNRREIFTFLSRRGRRQFMRELSETFCCLSDLITAILSSRATWIVTARNIPNPDFHAAYLNSTMSSVREKRDKSENGTSSRVGAKSESHLGESS